MDQIQTVYQKMQALHNAVLSGEKFATLPKDLFAVMASVKSVPATAVQAPETTQATLDRLADVAKLIKDAKAPVLDDDTLRFLVAQLGSTDPQVRDKGAWFALGDLLQNHVLSPAQVVWLFKQLQTPEVLFDHILEPHNDAVFKRSFAVMVLSAVVYADRTHYHVLTAQDYQNLVMPLAMYIALENDGRGYVEQSGWAHSFMHIANLLDELTQIEPLKRADKVFLLFTAVNAWQRMQDALVFGEDQRFALYLTNLAGTHQFYAQSLVLALTSWQRRLRNLRPGESLAFWNRWYNRSRLLEACIMRADMPQIVVDYLQKIIDMY
ncbi:DUF2785 domain-containing protein [Lacticaseibacillus jixiensis]|uniref:DUF2785 domain-containing protein n=1 Tax=Lacticaseibacillus jixiensis TaxID=3231926 RepID=UPI0036F32DD2